jgi:hypothetical protein
MDPLRCVYRSSFSQLSNKARLSGRASFLQIKDRQQIKFHFQTLLDSSTMTTFNQYPVRKPFVADIWHKSSKEQKRVEASALVDAFLRDGGQITKAAPKKRKSGGRTEIFGKDTTVPKVHEHWSRKFFAGHDFCQRGPRFTSKPASEKSADQRDLARKAGTAHAEFAGAVVSINGKLAPRHALHTADEAPVDMVSKGGSEKVVTLVNDAADDLSDANRRARIRDELNLTNVDHTHNARFKLAA